MDLGPILIQEQLLDEVLSMLESIQELASKISQVSERSSCTESEKKSQKRVFGKLRLLIFQIMTKVLDAQASTSAKTAAAKTRSEIVLLSTELGSEIVDAEIYDWDRSNFEIVSFCSDAEAAEKISFNLELIDQSIEHHAQKIRESGFKIDKNYLVACGELLTLTCSIRVEIYLAHRKLIPNHEWQEIVNLNSCN